MSESSSDEDISPVFACRADNIMQKQREAYEEMMKKVEEENEPKPEPVKDKEEELLGKIHEILKPKPRGKRKAKVPSPPPEKEESVPLKRSSRQRNKQIAVDDSSEKHSKTKITSSPINLPPRAKKKLMKIDLENKRDLERIEKLNKRVLSSCLSSSTDDQNTSIDIEAEQNVTLRISYLTEISKITVGENEKFSSIISKVADLFNQKATEIALCLRSEIISLDDTPNSLKVKSWEIIDCIPYKQDEKMQDDTDSNKILIKLQSNDCKKKIEIYAHQLEKFGTIMEQYSQLRSLPLKDLIFEFDGEKISDSDTPRDLDMESGSCVDVRVIGDSLKPSPPSIPVVDLEREETPRKMLDICVLD